MTLLGLICGNLMEYQKNIAPSFVDHYVLEDISFNGHCLLNNIYIPKTVINMYISYILNSWLRNLNTDFTLNNCLGQKKVV